MDPKNAIVHLYNNGIAKLIDVSIPNIGHLLLNNYVTITTKSQH